MGVCIACLKEDKSISLNYSDSVSLVHNITRDFRLEDLYEVFEGFTSTNSGITRKGALRPYLSPVYEIRSIYTKNRNDLLQQIVNVVSILKDLAHPNIERIAHIFENEGVFHIVVGPGECHSLYERIEDKKRFTEEETVIIIKQVLQAVFYLHGRGICHRNLSPESVFIHQGDNGLSVRVGGFDYATTFLVQGEEVLMDSMVGVTVFMAPEMINGYYKQHCDLWSVGVITYLMLFGTLPFYAEDAQVLHERILSGNFAFPSKVSARSTEFIKGLLQVDASKRLTIQEATSHPWMSEALINIS